MNKNELFWTFVGDGEVLFLFRFVSLRTQKHKNMFALLKKKQNTLMCVSVETYQPQADNVQRVIIQGRGKLEFKQSHNAFMSGFTASHLNEY